MCILIKIWKKWKENSFSFLPVSLDGTYVSIQNICLIIRRYHNLQINNFSFLLFCFGVYYHSLLIWEIILMYQVPIQKLGLLWSWKNCLPRAPPLPGSCSNLVLFLTYFVVGIIYDQPTSHPILLSSNQNLLLLILGDSVCQGSLIASLPLGRESWLVPTNWSFVPCY